MSTPSDTRVPTRIQNADVDAFAAAWESLGTAEERGALEEAFFAAHPRNPLFGEVHELDGERWRETTFLWRNPAGEAPPRDVMIHINSVTDGHREDIRPALFERVAASSLWQIGYLLPESLIASYRIVLATASDEPLPREGGQDRSSWMRIHQLGRPDPRGEGTLPNPLGVQSSVLAMPEASEHPVWSSAEFRRGSTMRTVEVPSRDGALRRLYLYRPHVTEAPRRLLVLFDGDVWQELGVQDALDRWEGEPIAAVLVSSVSPERRSADLPHPEQIARIVRDEVLPTAFREFGREYSAAEIIVSGQSYGGLATAAIVSEYPEIALHGVAQSPSFHFRADEEPRRPNGQRGDVSTRLAQSTSTGRLVITVGLNEGGLLEQARIARTALRETAMRVHYREFAGGHDYAWWRHGLFWGLDALRSELDSSPGS